MLQKEDKKKQKYWQPSAFRARKRLIPREGCNFGKLPPWTTWHLHQQSIASLLPTVCSRIDWSLWL